MKTMTWAAALAVATAAPVGPALAQFTDLQPGRNFPAADTAFGMESSENLEFGDIDNDGDLDVVVANGGDAQDQQNRIFVNLGGLQGGVEGLFSETTATSFATLLPDESRDVDFVDIDADGDLDLFVANKGGNTVGQVSRFWANQGGLQGGTLGTFVEVTDTAWGTLVDVPADQQVFGGNAGPFTDWSCDCEFGDLDGDDDMDLLFASYGPAVNGTRRSRVFLNDGTGVFNEHWPWVDPGADDRWHGVDVDLVDLDADFDLDIVVANRDSQIRIFHNNTNRALPGSQELFTDTTAESLVSNGVTFMSTSVYEAEAFDGDEDGDFDLWIVNYDGFADAVLRNDGLGADGAVDYSIVPGVLKGDPNQDENEVDLLDFDGDGDLDVLAANFSGTNWLYVSGRLQDLSTPDGFPEYHRSGTPSGGGTYTFAEGPASGNGGRSLDVEAGDLDGDGDPDVGLANEAGQNNRVWFNALGIPDSHAPRFLVGPTLLVGGASIRVETQVIDAFEVRHAQRLDVALFFSADGGAEWSVPMIHRGSGLFAATIPGGAAASVLTWRVEATDRAGNTGVASGVTGGAAWPDLGCALAGAAGEPLLEGFGALTAGSFNVVQLSGAAPSASALLFVSLASNATPFKGGTLKTVPVLAALAIPTGAGGGVSLPFTAPAVPGGADIYLQWAIADGGAVQGVALSNAVLGAFPP